jgi:hypothetical protein
MAKSFLRDLLAKPFPVHRSPVRMPGIVAWTPIASAGSLTGLFSQAPSDTDVAPVTEEKASQLVRE